MNDNLMSDEMMIAHAMLGEVAVLYVLDMVAVRIGVNMVVVVTVVVGAIVVRTHRVGAQGPRCQLGAPRPALFS